MRLHGVSETDEERRADERDERVRQVQNGKNDDGEQSRGEELVEEDVAESLAGLREEGEDPRWTLWSEDGGLAFQGLDGQSDLGELLLVDAVYDERSEEGSEDLADDVLLFAGIPRRSEVGQVQRGLSSMLMITYRNLTPRKTFEDCKGNGVTRTQMGTRRGA